MPEWWLKCVMNEFGRGNEFTVSAHIFQVQFQHTHTHTHIYFKYNNFKIHVSVAIPRQIQHSFNTHISSKKPLSNIPQLQNM